MREKEATAVLKAIVSPAGRAELSNYRNNLVLPLDYVRAIKIDSPIKDAVTEFQAGNYSNLFKYEEKVAARYGERKSGAWFIRFSCTSNH